MIATSLLWLALGLPGYAFARRFFLRDLAAGGLGAVAVAYFWTLALLTPLSFVCYLFEAPLWVFSSGSVLLVVLAAVDLWRARCFSGVSRWARRMLRVEALIVLGLVASSAAVGGMLSGDARFHTARVRQFLEHGFSNHDPYVLPHAFARAYHTNLYHPLLASLAELSGQEYLVTWSATLPWVKLLGAGGFYALAFAIFRRRDAAWITASALLLGEVDITYAVAPNQLTGRFLLPLAFVYVTRLSNIQIRVRDVVALGMSLVVLAEFHALYAVFASLVAGAVFVIQLARGRLGRVARRSSAARVLLALFVTTTPAPFISASLWVGRAEPGAPPPAYMPVLDSQALARGLELQSRWREDYADKKADRNAKRGVVEVGEGRRAVDPTVVLGANAWLLGALALLVFVQRKVGRALPVVVAAGAAIAFLHVPELFSALSRHGGGDWVVLRIGVLKKVALLAVAPAALLLAVERQRWLGGRGALRAARIGVLPLALLIFAPETAKLTGHFSAAQSAVVSGQPELLRLLEERAELVDRVPAGAVVLAVPSAARSLVMLHDVHVIAADRMSPRIPHATLRRSHLALALAPETGNETRARILAAYGVTHAYIKASRRQKPEWLEPFARATGRVRGAWLFELELPKARD